MATNIDRVDTRTKLKVRRDPYWKGLTRGRYVRFRRLTKDTPGTWLARFYDGERYQYSPLGDFANLSEKTGLMLQSEMHRLGSAILTRAALPTIRPSRTPARLN